MGVMVKGIPLPVLVGLVLLILGGRCETISYSLILILSYIEIAAIPRDNR